MRRKDEDPIYSEVLAVFGIHTQVSKAIEELAELQVALSHYLCGREPVLRSESARRLQTLKSCVSR